MQNKVPEKRELWGERILEIYGGNPSRIQQSTYRLMHMGKLCGGRKNCLKEFEGKVPSTLTGPEKSACPTARLEAS